MNGIFRFKKNQPVNWFHRNKANSNQYCLYCGRLVGSGSTIASNKEHLVAREFVPTGEFETGSCFNFIFRACKSCNDEKSNAERHVSSVSLVNSPARMESEAHDGIALRKAAKDYHPAKRGVLVQDSGDDIPISTKLSGMGLDVNFSGPPQVNTDDALLLAFRQVQGMFSLVTSADPTSAQGTSLLSAEYFRLVGIYSHGDWGNPQLLEIAARASKIPCIANIVTANGFFKVIMRRANGEKGEWFWALQWNKAYRVIGTIGQPSHESHIFQDLPPLSWTNLGIQDGAITRIRREVPLLSGDLLFEGEVENPESR